MISIIFPVFNEEKRVREGLSKTLAYFSQQKDSFELIVVNDGSTDRTSEILQTFTDQPNLKILNHEQNRGKGAAVKTGVMAAKGDFILFSDIDLSVPLETLANFLKTAESGFDLVIGSRRVAGAKILTHQGFWRELMGHTFTKISNFVLGTDFADFTCGFKLFKKEAARKIFDQVRIADWAFDSEVLFLARKMGFKVAQMRVTWSDVKDSKVRFPQDIMTSFLGLLRIRWFDWCRQYPPKPSQ